MDVMQQHLHFFVQLENLNNTGNEFQPLLRPWNPDLAPSASFMEATACASTRLDCWQD
jgi:hypothetical protein